VVLLAGATAFSAVVAAIIPNLGWNLLADAISLWFGLFVVDLALAKGRAEAELPAHRAMVDDLVRVRSPISQVLMLFLWEAATMADIPEMRLAARGEGDVAEILSRKALASPAPMRKLGLITGPQASWKDVIFRGLSPEALRLESLIARYITVADSPILAALQGLETSMFADVMRGRIVYADDAILRVVMWRSLIQSLAALDTELEVALTRHPDRGAALGPASYVDLAITFVEQGVA
jgi:hypothetical protein